MLLLAIELYSKLVTFSVTRKDNVRIWLIFIIISYICSNTQHTSSYLDNVHLWMLQKLGKDRDSLMLENSVSLRVVACHDVT